ncbi:MAG: hypothetical protein A2413_08930 [Treponema sp. RIFOXYC1_FULL_61_9]|nr:MAG: hypothetical protein A2Y36_17770 [Treponema sp. GWA1_62_8]OHE63745.1 MAG: hypothetical protein A2001_00820 [Treponema sp. GWC1_61_84]OHE69267.1 MAG: hypothetical protein A2413_08930 [Treponema sp. RIFOXYC1_FULL_61_9]
MSNRSNKAAALALAAAMIASSAAFAEGKQESAASAAKPVVLTVTYATGDPLTKETTHEIIERFQKANPGVKIQENLSVSTGAYLDSLKTMNAADMFPDFFECRDTPVFVRAEMLAPLPQELVPIFESPISIYGTVYTAPYSAAGPNGIMYDKKFFRENGLNENPKTYAEFIQLCEAIKAKGVAPLVAGISDIWHLGFWFGKYWVDNIGTKNPDWIADRYAGKVKFSDPDFAKGIQQMVDLFRKGYVEGGFMSTKESQCVSVLLAGKAAMYYCGTHVFTQIKEADPAFELGWFPVPDDAGNVKLMGGASSNGWALSAKAAQDPEKVKAFTAFIKFFFRQEQYAYFLQTTNGFPTTKEKMNYTVSGTMATVLDAFGKAPKSLNWNQGLGANEMPSTFRNWSYKKLQEAMLGQVSVADALKAMDAEWEVQSRDFNPSTLKKAALVPVATK